MINFLYSWILLPITLLLFRLSALLNQKHRIMLRDRQNTDKKINDWLLKKSGQNKTIIFHAASLGEYEHIRFFIKRIKEGFKVNIILTFFSPSGYQNIKSNPHLDLVLYLPFDLPKQISSFYKKINPAMICISKHDAWYNQVRIARKMNIPVYLINASLPENSSRRTGIIRNFLKVIYENLTWIYTISYEDEIRFKQTFGIGNVSKIGDTKFDQVFERKKKLGRLSEILEPYKAKNVIIFGSVWAQDLKIILPAIKTIDISDWYLIFVPHQPTRSIHDYIKENLADYPILNYSEISSEQIQTARILIIDKIGLLADIYSLGKIAYVGGSFNQGIHNVMEPAIYGLPVIYGPVYKNAYEAIRLIEANGSFSINNSDEFRNVLTKLMADEELRENSGLNAKRFAEQNTGVTETLVALLKEHFSNQ